MKKISLDNKFFVKLKLLYKILLILGLVFIVVGIVLLCFSLRHEVLSDGYIITDVKERIFKGDLHLSKGEIRAVKSTDYIGKGTYKLTYENYFKELDKGDLLAKGTYFSIIDVIGRGYHIDANKIEVNGKNYVFESLVIRTDEGILIEYTDRTLFIEIPDQLASKKNNIVVYITLKEREEFFEYVTTEDCYFNLLPNVNNDFYAKKSSQSYMIDGYGYIKLKKK